MVFGRWLENNSSVLVLAEPTRGVDVGARAEIYEVLDKLADEGIAISIISTDAEEVLRISDRIMVMSDGRVTDVIPREEASMARLTASSAAVVVSGDESGGNCHERFDYRRQPWVFRRVCQADLGRRLSRGVCCHGLRSLGAGLRSAEDGRRVSRDHHWGLRIDAIMPLELLQARWPAIQEALEARLPHSYQGHALGERAVVGAGITPDSLAACFRARSASIIRRRPSRNGWQFPKRISPT